MNWKHEAIGKLKRYEAMQAAMVSLPQELKRLEEENTAIRSARSDSTPVKGGASRREEAMLNNIMERQEVTQALNNAVAWVQIVDRGLSCLTKEEKTILQRIYIYPEKNGLKRLCEELGVEMSSVYRRRDKALQTFTLALYGATGEEW